MEALYGMSPSVTSVTAAYVIWKKGDLQLHRLPARASLTRLDLLLFSTTQSRTSPVKRPIDKRSGNPVSLCISDVYN
jgi:hypothetical protein